MEIVGKKERKRVHNPLPTVSKYKIKYYMTIIKLRFGFIMKYLNKKVMGCFILKYLKKIKNS